MNDFVTASCIGVRGEFGNQLFQIAAVLGHAHRTGKEAVFQPWVCSHGGRNYSVSFPGLNYRERVRPANIYTEPRFAYDPIPCHRKLDLIGSFQSERYFIEIADSIRKLFSEPVEIEAKVDAYLMERSLDDFSALQMRFNDRDVLDSNTVMHTLPEHYFLAAVARLNATRPVVIVSNGLTRARLFAKQHLRDRNVHVVSHDDALVDFYLLTRASQLAIANSTFGWWGAYLNPRVDKVFAPLLAKWFAFPSRLEARWDTKDLYPSHFVEVPF